MIKGLESLRVPDQSISHSERALMRQLPRSENGGGTGGACLRRMRGAGWERGGPSLTVWFQRTIQTQGGGSLFFTRVDFLTCLIRGVWLKFGQFHCPPAEVSADEKGFRSHPRAGAAAARTRCFCLLADLFMASRRCGGWPIGRREASRRCGGWPIGRREAGRFCGGWPIGRFLTVLQLSPLAHDASRQF